MGRELQIILPRLCLHLQTYQVRVFPFVRPGTVRVLFFINVMQAWNDQEHTCYPHRAAATRAKFATLHEVVLHFESSDFTCRCILCIITESCVAACK